MDPEELGASFNSFQTLDGLCSKSGRRFYGAGIRTR